jgi:NADH-quinone oxidoreductase subunit J
LPLVAIIAAIALTLRERKDSKYVNPSDQVRVKAADRMRVVQVVATKNVANNTEDAPANSLKSSEQGAKA